MKFCRDLRNLNYLFQSFCCPYCFVKIFYIVESLNVEMFTFCFFLECPTQPLVVDCLYTPYRVRLIIMSCRIMLYVYNVGFLVSKFFIRLEFYFSKLFLSGFNFLGFCCFFSILFFKILLRI